MPSPIAAGFDENAYSTLFNNNANNNLKDKPKAYLNFVTFDDQFNMVNKNSELRQPKPGPNALNQLYVEPMVIEKQGVYTYIYLMKVKLLFTLTI